MSITEAFWGGVELGIIGTLEIILLIIMVRLLWEKRKSSLVKT